MWRYPIIIARLWIENVNIFLRSVGTRLVRKTAESVLRNLDLMGQMQDLFSSVELERQHLAAVPTFKTRQDLFRFALDRAGVGDGLHAEFGVYKGDSINRLARLRPHKLFHGFDSFEGLPEIPEIDRQKIWEKGKLKTTEEDFRHVVEKNGIITTKPTT